MSKRLKGKEYVNKVSQNTLSEAFKLFISIKCHDLWECLLCFGFPWKRENEKKKKKRNNSQLCLLSLRDTEIPLATLISALSAVDNILSEPTTIHHVILDGASVMFREDHHGVSRQPWLRRVLCLGPLRPSPPGGTAGRWM